LNERLQFLSSGIFLQADLALSDGHAKCGVGWSFKVEAALSLYLLLLQEEFEAELKRRLDEIGQKVADTVKRSEEQSEIIDRLQGNVSFSGHLGLCAKGFRIVRWFEHAVEPYKCDVK